MLWGVLNVSKVGQVLFGDGVLADVGNLDNFLGVTSSTYHFTRLSCRKTIDGVVGTGQGMAGARGHGPKPTTPATVPRDRVPFNS